MDRSPQPAVEFLALSTSSVAQSNAILEQLAAAIAGVAPIYTLDPDSGSQRRLDEAQLAFGVFQRGATVLRTPKSEHRGLTIRRLDVRAAIEAFRRAGRTF